MNRIARFRKFLKNNIDASYSLIDDPNCTFEDKKRYVYIKTGYEQARDEFERIFKEPRLWLKRLLAGVMLVFLALYLFLLYFYLTHR